MKQIIHKTLGIAILAFFSQTAMAIDVTSTFTTGATLTAAQMTEVSTAVNSKQNIVSGICAAGSSIRVINADGTVTCEGSQKQLTINPFGGMLTDGTITSGGFGANAGVLLPDTGTPQIAYGFVIPSDYTSGASVTLNFVVHSPSTSCGIVLAPNYVAVARAGRTHIVGVGASTGLTAIGGDTITIAAANTTIVKQYALTSPSNTTTLQANDSFIFGLFRSAAQASDTCTGNLVIQGIYITY